MSINKKTLSIFWSILVLVVSVIIGIGFATYSNNILPIFMGIGCLLFGPITAILYLVEVKRGVFNIDDDNSK